MYQKVFIEAIKRTQKFKFELETPLIDSSESMIGVNTYQEIQKELINRFPDFGAGNRGYNCHIVSNSMKPIIERILDCECYLTIGGYSIEDKVSYELKDDEIYALLSRARVEQIAKIPFHVWLTLPSMEIIDFTIGHWFALKTNNYVSKTEFLMKHPDSLEGGLRYSPMLVGGDFLRKLGVLRDL